MVVFFTAVTMPFAAKVREPVVPSPAQRKVSDVIAIVIAPALLSLMKVIAVPTGKGTLAFAGIVQIRAVVSALG